MGIPAETKRHRPRLLEKSVWLSEKSLHACMIFCTEICVYKDKTTLKLSNDEAVNQRCVEKRNKVVLFPEFIDSLLSFDSHANYLISSFRVSLKVFNQSENIITLITVHDWMDQTKCGDFAISSRHFVILCIGYFWSFMISLDQFTHIGVFSVASSLRTVVQCGVLNNNSFHTMWMNSNRRTLIIPIHRTSE